jgi:hypothetical protein
MTQPEKNEGREPAAGLSRLRRCPRVVMVHIAEPAGRSRILRCPTFRRTSPFKLQSVAPIRWWHRFAESIQRAFKLFRISECGIKLSVFLSLSLYLSLSISLSLYLFPFRLLSLHHPLSPIFLAPIPYPMMSHSVSGLIGSDTSETPGMLPTKRS